MHDTSATPVPMTPSEARTKLDALQNDKAWGAKVLAGSDAEVRQFKDLSAEAAKADRYDRAFAGEEVAFETTFEGHLSTRAIASAIEGYREAGFSDELTRSFLEGRPISAQDRATAENFRRTRMNDPEWTKRWLAGDANAAREYTAAQMDLLRPVLKPEEK